MPAVWYCDAVVNGWSIAGHETPRKRLWAVCPAVSRRDFGQRDRGLVPCFARGRHPAQRHGEFSISIQFTDSRDSARLGLIERRRPEFRRDS
jgi:hypothetical protein